MNRFFVLFFLNESHSRGIFLCVLQGTQHTGNKNWQPGKSLLSLNFMLPNTTWYALLHFSSLRRTYSVSVNGSLCRKKSHMYSYTPVSKLLSQSSLSAPSVNGEIEKRVSLPWWWWLVRREVSKSPIWWYNAYITGSRILTF